jgi:cytosine permease
MAADVLGISFPAWGVTIFWGLVMGFFAMYGYHALRRFYYIMTPVLFLLLIFAVIHTLFLSEAGSAPAPLAWRPAEPVSYITAITVTVGGWTMGAFTIGDYCRYAKKRDAVLGISAGLTMMLVVFLSGAIFRVVTGNADITVILRGMGYPAMSLVFLILSNWAINVPNAYSGGIALSVLLNLGEKRQKAGIALTAITGTVLGAAGILPRFTDFLSLFSPFVPPCNAAFARKYPHELH